MLKKKIQFIRSFFSYKRKKRRVPFQTRSLYTRNQLIDRIKALSVITRFGRSTE